MFHVKVPRRDLVPGTAPEVPGGLSCCGALQASRGDLPSGAGTRSVGSPRRPIPPFGPGEAPAAVGPPSSADPLSTWNQRTQTEGLFGVVTLTADLHCDF